MWLLPVTPTPNFHWSSYTRQTLWCESWLVKTGGGIAQGEIKEACADLEEGLVLSWEGGWMREETGWSSGGEWPSLWNASSWTVHEVTKPAECRVPTGTAQGAWGTAEKGLRVQLNPNQATPKFQGSTEQLLCGIKGNFTQAGDGEEREPVAAKLIMSSFIFLKTLRWISSESLKTWNRINIPWKGAAIWSRAC